MVYHLYHGFFRDNDEDNKDRLGYRRLRSIVISGPPAVGKTTVARGLAKHYNIRWINGGDILKEMAREQGLKPDGESWWDTPRGMVFLGIREKNFDLDRDVDNRLLEMCLQGDVVITSYTLPWLDADAVKVWLDCSQDVAASRLQYRDGVDAVEARKIADKRHQHNTRLYKKYYGFRFGPDKSIFDIMVYTNGKDADEVVAEVVAKLEDI